jgi:hypothetical protein
MERKEKKIQGSRQVGVVLVGKVYLDCVVFRSIRRKGGRSAMNRGKFRNEFDGDMGGRSEQGKWLFGDDK